MFPACIERAIGIQEVPNNILETRVESRISHSSTGKRREDDNQPLCAPTLSSYPISRSMALRIIPFGSSPSLGRRVSTGVVSGGTPTGRRFEPTITSCDASYYGGGKGEGGNGGDVVGTERCWCELTDA